MIGFCHRPKYLKPVHIQKLLDIVNNQFTVEGFYLDDVKAMLGELSYAW